MKKESYLKSKLLPTSLTGAFSRTGFLFQAKTLHSSERRNFKINKVGLSKIII